MTQTATISHTSATGAVDAYGNPTDVITTSTAACFVSYLPGSEVEGDTIQVQTPVLFLPPDIDIDGGDAVTVDGVTYQIDGPPAQHYNPRLRRVTHIQANLRQAA